MTKLKHGRAPSGQAGRSSTGAAKASPPYGDHPSRKFTPGPWKLIPCPCGNQFCSRQQFANVGTFYVGTGFEPADARLIAAAPDYDDFTVEALPQLEVLHSTLPAGEARNAVWRVILKGRAALSKARGEQVTA